MPRVNVSRLPPQRKRTAGPDRNQEIINHGTFRHLSTGECFEITEQGNEIHFVYTHSRSGKTRSSTTRAHIDRLMSFGLIERLL